jgi:hypothetical protein
MVRVQVEVFFPCSLKTSLIGKFFFVMLFISFLTRGINANTLIASDSTIHIKEPANIVPLCQTWARGGMVSARYIFASYAP